MRTYNMRAENLRQGAKEDTRAGDGGEGGLAAVRKRENEKIKKGEYK